MVTPSRSSISPKKLPAEIFAYSLQFSSSSDIAPFVIKKTSIFNDLDSFKHHFTINYFP